MHNAPRTVGSVCPWPSVHGATMAMPPVNGPAAGAAAAAPASDRVEMPPVSTGFRDGGGSETEVWTRICTDLNGSPYTNFDMFSGFC